MADLRLKTYPVHPPGNFDIYDDIQGVRVATLYSNPVRPLQAEQVAKLISAAPDLAELWEPSDPLGALYQLGLAAKILKGEVPAESFDGYSLGVNLEQRAEAARKALEKAGVEVAHG